MVTMQKAKQVLHDAEGALQNLISEASAEKRYSDVKEIAELADRVAQLIAGNSNQLSVPVSKPTIDQKSHEKNRYPKFCQDKDRLVKTGWSKTDRKEYKHHLPLEVVLAFLEHLNSSVSEAEVFDIDSLSSVKNAAGEDVPRYQVYVVVSWLKEAGVIKKKGREGYLICDKSVLDSELNELRRNLQGQLRHKGTSSGISRPQKKAKKIASNSNQLSVSASKPTINQKSHAKNGYPKFRQDKDRLVKIGWSKKNRKENKYRVPREVVLAFLHHLNSSVSEAKVFDINSLSPVKDAAGEDVSRDQVYVVVSWLKEAGVIKKKGRGGYLIRDKSVLDSEWNELRRNLRARTA